MSRIAILCLLVFVVVSCKRAVYQSGFEDCQFKLTPQTRMLVGKRWTETSIQTKKLDGDQEFKDITRQFMPSDLDDIVIFNKDGTYLFDEGKTKAREKGAQIYESGTWCICNPGNQLVLGTGPSRTVYEIVRLENDHLVLHLLRPDSEVYLLTYQPLD